MISIHRSIFFSGIERYGSLVLFLFSTAVLSRLLTPAEFGVYAVINAIAATVCASLQEFGGANYLILRSTLSKRHIRTAFTITFGISALLAIALIGCSNSLARFFGQEEIRVGIVVSTLGFAATPFSVVISALFRRDMQFGRIAICSLAANTVSTAVSIVLAVLHYSFMAPIWGSVAGNLALALLLIGFCKRKNVLRFSVSEYRDVLHFSLYSGGVSVINVLYNLAPQLFLVRILDFAAAGLYSNAISIAKVFDRLIGQVLGPVIMPAIASRNRVGGDLKRIYLDAMALLSVVHWPFLAFLAIMAQPIVSLWLGPAWLEVVPLARMLCIGSLSLFVASLTYPTLVAIGSVRDALIASAISLPPSLLVTLVASFMGVQAVAASAMLTLPFQASVATYFIGRHLNISLREILHATYKSGLVALCSSAATAVCATMAEYGLIQQAWGLALGCLFASMCWLFMVIVTDHPILPRLQLSGIGFWRLLHAPASREARLIRITPE